jgi:hypothetical protein
MGWWYRSAIVAVWLCMLPVGAVVRADGPESDLKGFWSKGDAGNWEQAVTPNSSQGVAYRNYPQMVDRVKADAEARRKERIKLLEDLGRQGRQDNVTGAANQAPSADQDQTQASASPSQPPAASTPLSREEIVAKYGSPEQPQLIRAQKDSPPAMQGLFEALNSGDKELAWQYAVALAKRQVEMQSVVSKATDYQMLAMEALGVRQAGQPAPDEQEVDPTREEVQEFMNRTRQAEQTRRVPFDPNIAAGETNGPVGGDPSASDRAAKSSSPLEKIPVDPEGKVKVLMFFDEKAPDAIQLAEAIRPLTGTIAKDAAVSFVGLTKRTYRPAGLKLRSAELSFPFPLVSGEALALDLRIQRYPTFVFVAVTTRQTYRIEGVPTLAEIERVVRVMRGGN